MDLIKIHSSDKETFVGYAESRIGGRTENQDSFTFGDTPFGFLVTVCDGMGGGPGGKTASSIAVTEILKGVKEAEGDDLKPAEVVTAAVKQANAAIIAATEVHPELKGMGSTATVLLLNEQAAVVAHVGDSRVYQLRGRQKVFRTFDHSVVFDMVRQGIITEEQARLSAQSNVITRALGVAPEVEVEIDEVPYEAGDRFMLCTDGIHGSMPERELLRLIADTRVALGPVADNIATTVDEIGRREGGEHDNLTLALIQTKSNSKLKPKMPKKVKDMLLALGVVCALSLVLNVVLLLTRSSSPADTTELENTVKAQKTEIQKLTDSVATMNEKLQTKNDSLEQLKKANNAAREALFSAGTEQKNNNKR
ncbi:MAG: serine/threonine-protein phosphatase [Prevotella sp.]|nr:serine/threonine-protein phosphatase [Prevotella sp.]